MITFLPDADFEVTAGALDRLRLGSQRREALSILAGNLKDPERWRRFPQNRMWLGYEKALLQYGLAICHEWKRRGYQDTCAGKMLLLSDAEVVLAGNSVQVVNAEMPPWLGWEDLHASHRAILLAKRFEHYSQFGWKEEPADLTTSKMPYVWPGGK